MRVIGTSGHVTKAILVITGAMAGIVQIVVLREILAGFSGTELLTGVIMAGWLLLNSIGCLIPRRTEAAKFKTVLQIQAVLGVAAAFCCAGMLLGCSYLSSNAHSQIDWISYSFLALLVVLPFCLCAGFQYTYSVQILMQLPAYDESKSASNAYVCDSIGMLVGFLLGTFFLATKLNPIETAILVLCLNLLTSALIACCLTENWRPGILLASSAAIIVIVLFSEGMPSKLFHKAIALRVPNETLEKAMDTKYARLYITSLRNQYNFYVNDYLEGSFPDNNPAIEKQTHFALLLHNRPEKVFIMGGLTSGVLDVVLKHQPKEVVYGDIDPGYLSLALEFLKEKNNSQYNDVKFIDCDVRSYLQQSGDLYDVIILIPPPPAALSSNRYFTTEFFQTARSALREDGLLCTCVPSSETYSGASMKRLNSSIYKAICTTFHGTLILPGDEGIIMARNQVWEDSFLEETVLRRYNDRHIESTLVIPEYIHYILTFRRMYAAQESFNFNGQSIVNTDFFPSAMLYYAAYKSENENSMAYSLLNWISMQTPENLLIIALLLLTAPLIVRIRVFHPANYSAKPSAGYICFLSGMCGFSCVSIVIYMYQIKIGSLYGDIGLISAANFCGYALAAIVTNRLKRSNGRTLVFIFLCIQSLLIPVVLSGTITIFTEKWMFFLLMLILGALNGSVYPFLIRCAPAAHYGRTQKWIKMYVCELFGAAAGAVVIGLLLLSTMGLINIVILILAALTVSILQIFGWQKDKRKYVGINTDGQE